MIKQFQIAVALIALACIGVVDAQGNKPQPSPSIAGKWILTTADGPHGAQKIPVTFVQDGRKVTATVTSPHGGDIALAGELANGEFKLATAQDADHRVTLQGKLKDDGTLTGFMSTPGGDLTWTAVRANEKQ